MKHLLSFAFMVLVFASCQKELNVDNPQVAEKTILNVAYGTSTEQRMDVYLPANRTTTATKVLVLVHGGAWTTGDKADFDEYIPVFRQRLPDYALINVNYRLAKLPDADLFPTQENDIKAALDFILSKGGEYSFNKEKLVMFGASAGSHLALLQSYKNPETNVKALVDMFGPTDMVDLYNNASSQIEQLAIKALLSGTPTTNAALYQNSSPINFVSAQSPPTLILHGGLDPLVPLSQSLALKARLESANVPVQLVIYPGEAHGWTGASLTDSYEKIASFLSQYNP
jgi:acetyl esterase/lipase